MKLLLSICSISILITSSLTLPLIESSTDSSTEEIILNSRALRVVYTNATNLPQSKINLIKQVLNNNANESWEIGTHMQALTEFDYPTLSPFFASYNPPPTNPFGASVMTLVSRVISTKPNGTLPLMPDGSVGDPASMGVGVTLGNWTIGNAIQLGVTGQICARAALEQVRYLLEVAPRTSDGAISHRSEQIQLWSDSVYMVPPFLSYYGVMTRNATIIQASYDQCRLYRQYLRRPSGLWAHIVLGTAPDSGLWATGNGWAAAGMLRTYVTIKNSNYANQFKSQTDDLAKWVIEIVEACFALQQPNNYFFPNYFNDTNTFTDAASVAILTSVSYRLAQLSLSNSTLPKAELSRQAIYAAVNPVTGILLPVVNPLAYPYEGTMSPEGQAFVLLMEAAWRDWVGGGGIVSSLTIPGPVANVPRVGGSSSTSNGISSHFRLNKSGMDLSLIGGLVGIGLGLIVVL